MTDSPTRRDLTPFGVHFVVDGVRPHGSPVAPSLFSQIDNSFVWPFVPILLFVEILLGLNIANGQIDAFVGVVVGVIAACVVVVVVVVPALVRRLGHQPEGRVPRTDDAAEAIQFGLSIERVLLAKSRRNEDDMIAGLRRRLRQDLPVLLLFRGLDLDNPEHGAQIEELIGSRAWDIVRPERPRSADWRGLRLGDIDEVLAGCLRAIGDP